MLPNLQYSQGFCSRDVDSPIFPFFFLLAGILLFTSSASAATTSIHIEKVAADGKTLLFSGDVDAGWMEANLPVYGDGVTHYYHQGPVFVDDPDQVNEEILRWNKKEDHNVQEKDLGALKGTALKDLCNIAGGMDPGDTVTIRARDGFKKTFAYRNIYMPTERQGPMVIAWYCDGEGYVPDYSTGMRLVFFADTSGNPWGIHAFGNWDWHESADSEYYYYYVQGNEHYPTTTGLSVQEISTISIHRQPSAALPVPVKETPTTPLCTLTALGILGGYWIVFRNGDSR